MDAINDALTARDIALANANLRIMELEDLVAQLQGDQHA
jgi:hypothetical protein